MEALGMPQITGTDVPVVHLVHAHQGIDHGIGNLRSPLVVVERRWQRDGVDALDHFHQEERASDHVVVVAQRHYGRMGDPRAHQRLENAVLPPHPVVGPVQCHLGRPPQYPSALSPVDPEHDIRRPTAERLDRKRLADLDPPGIEP
jgi:hypothetical protein